MTRHFPLLFAVSYDIIVSWIVLECCLRPQCHQLSQILEIGVLHIIGDSVCLWVLFVRLVVNISID